MSLRDWTDGELLAALDQAINDEDEDYAVALRAELRRRGCSFS